MLTKLRQGLWNRINRLLGRELPWTEHTDEGTPEPFRMALGNRVWNIRFGTNPDAVGCCDDPSAEDRTIWLPPASTIKSTLESLPTGIQKPYALTYFALHEAIHAILYDLADEQWVVDTSRDLTILLQELNDRGYSSTDS